MANVLEKGSLFPTELTHELINQVRGKSSLARLSGAMPLSFNGNTIFTFSLDKEADLVAESGPKSNGGGTIGSKSVQPFKIEYGMRVSDEFLYASEEAQLDILRAFSDGFARKMARAIDITGMHGLNPRTAQAAQVLSGLSLDELITGANIITAGANANADVIAAIAAVEAGEHDVTGLAIAPTFRSSLAALTKGADSYEPLFPTLAWGGSDVSEINGLATDVNSTVAFGGSKDLAIVGNFADYFRWGIAREIPVTVLRYGCPDNDQEAGDLAGHNQVYIRAEAYIGFAVLDPTAFAKIVSE